MATIKRCMFWLSNPEDTDQLPFPEEYLNQTKVGHERRVRLIGANGVRSVRTLRKEGIFALGYDWLIYTATQGIRPYFAVLFEFIQGRSFEVFIFDRRMNQMNDARRPGINFNLLLLSEQNLVEPVVPNRLNGGDVVTLISTIGRFEIAVEVRFGSTCLTTGWSIFSQRHNLKIQEILMFTDQLDGTWVTTVFKENGCEKFAGLVGENPNRLFAIPPPVIDILDEDTDEEDWSEGSSDIVVEGVEEGEEEGGAESGEEEEEAEETELGQVGGNEEGEEGELYDQATITFSRKITCSRLKRSIVELKRYFLRTHGLQNTECIHISHGQGRIHHCPVRVDPPRTFIEGQEVKNMLNELQAHAGDTLVFTLLKGNLYNGEPRMDVHIVSP